MRTERLHANYAIMQGCEPATDADMQFLYMHLKFSILAQSNGSNEERFGLYLCTILKGEKFGIFF